MRVHKGLLIFISLLMNASIFVHGKKKLILSWEKSRALKSNKSAKSTKSIKKKKSNKSNKSNKTTSKYSPTAMPTIAQQSTGKVWKRRCTDDATKFEEKSQGEWKERRLPINTRCCTDYRGRKRIIIQLIDQSCPRKHTLPPTTKPTQKPTLEPTKEITKSPTQAPTQTPTKEPTQAPPKILQQASLVPASEGQQPTIAPTTPKGEPATTPSEGIIFVETPSSVAILPTEDPTQSPVKEQQPTFEGYPSATSINFPPPTEDPTLQLPVQEPTTEPTKQRLQPEPTKIPSDGFQPPLVIIETPSSVAILPTEPPMQSPVQEQQPTISPTKQTLEREPTKTPSDEVQPPAIIIETPSSVAILPTKAPTQSPVQEQRPTIAPTKEQAEPKNAPTKSPSDGKPPTITSQNPTLQPQVESTGEPTQSPEEGRQPISSPTDTSPSQQLEPTKVPSESTVLGQQPTITPTPELTEHSEPTAKTPTAMPSDGPQQQPTLSPVTKTGTNVPTEIPSRDPSSSQGTNNSSDDSSSKVAGEDGDRRCTSIASQYEEYFSESWQVIILAENVKCCPSLLSDRDVVIYPKDEECPSDQLNDYDWLKLGLPPPPGVRCVFDSDCGVSGACK